MVIGKLNFYLRIACPREAIAISIVSLTSSSFMQTSANLINSRAWWVIMSDLKIKIINKGIRNPDSIPEMFILCLQIGENVDTIFQNNNGRARIRGYFEVEINQPCQTICPKFYINEG
jgi:hypothetical protein